jgi:hypothetical protein
VELSICRVVRETLGKHTPHLTGKGAATPSTGSHFESSGDRNANR